MDMTYCTINLYDVLKIKYKDYLKPEIVSISIIQSEDTVWLEYIEKVLIDGSFEKQTIRKIDLEFISDGDEFEEKLYFDPKEPIENNARKFIDEFSPYSIINTTDLFNDDACDKINC